MENNFKSGEDLVQYVLENEERIKELTTFEMNILLFELISKYKKTQEKSNLLENVLNCLYSKEESKFYIEILNCATEFQRDNLVSNYAASNYTNDMFCRKGLKTFWDIEARIIKKRDFPKVKNVLPKLLEWMQDLNWPGADTILNLLANIPKDELIAPLELSIMQAIEEKDNEWMYNLKDLLEAVKIKQSDFKNQELYNICQKIEI